MKYRISGVLGFLILGVMLSAVHAENEYLALGQGSQKIHITAIKVTGTPDEGRNI